MSLLPNLSIRLAKTEDIAQIVQLAREEIGANPPFFLCGAASLRWKERDYLSHIASGNVYGAWHPQHGCIGFAVVFNDTHVGRPSRQAPARRDSVNLAAEMIGPDVPFIVVEQVIVAPQFSDLRATLLESLLSAPQLDAIVRNRRRSALRDLDATGKVTGPVLLSTCISDGHLDAVDPTIRRLGFELILQFRLEGHRIDGQGGRISQLWHHPNHLSVSEVFEKADAHDSLSALVALLENIQLLYMHEDDLNWKKLTVLYTFLFAQLAGLWVLIQNSLTPNLQGLSKAFNFCATLGVGLLGYWALSMTRRMLRSGQYFMAVHKANARILQARLRLRAPEMLPYLWGLPVKSRTVARLPSLPVIATALSILATGVAIAVLLIAWLADGL